MTIERRRQRVACDVAFELLSDSQDMLKLYPKIPMATSLGAISTLHLHVDSSGFRGSSGYEILE